MISSGDQWSHGVEYEFANFETFSLNDHSFYHGDLTTSAVVDSSLWQLIVASGKSLAVSLQFLVKK